MWIYSLLITLLFSDSKGVKKLESIYPYETGIHVVQTDNGSEFLPEFNEYLNKRNIKHNFIYPRCPRINGFIERSKNLLKKSADYKGVRTLQEEFIDLRLNLLLEDIDEFNRKLMDNLVWYNTERPHESLNNKSAEKSADYRGV
jgi:putative transposase